MSLVRTRSTTWISAREKITEGQIFDAAHPLVKRHPGLFEPLGTEEPTPAKPARGKAKPADG